MMVTLRVSKLAKQMLAIFLALGLCFTALIFSPQAANENANPNGQINSATNNGNGNGPGSNNGNGPGSNSGNANGKKNYIIGTKTEVGAEQVIAKNPGKGKKLGHNKKLLTAVLTPAEAQMIANDSNVLYVEEDFIVEANMETPETFPYLYFQSVSEEMEWDVKAVEAEYAHNQGYTGDGIKVAVLDSGVDTWSEIRVHGGIDLVNETATPSTDDLNGHGTAVAGIISTPITGEGHIGIAPESELFAVKVLDQNKAAPVSRILEGVDWCIANGMQVINMSFGTSNYSISLAEKVQEAYANGIVLVASAGNNGTVGGIQYPAKYPEVIAVASVDSSMTRVSTSATGSELSLSAPGERVQAAGSFGGYNVVSGTSIAAPHVSGVVTVLLGKNPAATPTFIRELLEVSAKPLGAEIEYGKGLVDLAFALELYDEFAANYANPSYEAPVNEMPAQDYSNDENYVNGMWSALGHDEIIGDSFYVGANDNNIQTMKKVSALIDTGNWTNQKRLHGAGNYVKTFRYLFDVAKGYRYTSGYNHTTYAPSYYSTSVTTPVTQVHTADENNIRDSLRGLITEMFGQNCVRSGSTFVKPTTATDKYWVVLGILAHFVGDLYAHRTIVPYEAVSGTNPLTKSGTKFGSTDFPARKIIPWHPAGNNSFDIDLMKDVLYNTPSCKCWGCFQRTCELGVMGFSKIKYYANSNGSWYEDFYGTGYFYARRLRAAKNVLWQNYAMIYYNDQPFDTWFLLPGIYGNEAQLELKLDLLWQYSYDYERSSGIYQGWLRNSGDYRYTTFLCNKTSCTAAPKAHYVVNKNLYKENPPFPSTRFPSGCKYAFET